MLSVKGVCASRRGDSGELSTRAVAWGAVMSTVNVNRAIWRRPNQPCAA